MSRPTIPVSELSQRELLLLQLLADGETYRTLTPLIGFKSPWSVKNFAKQVLDKLGADNKTHAVAMALRRHLIQ